MTIAATLVERAGSFTRHRGPVTCVAGLPGGAAAVTSAYDGAVGWFDLAIRPGRAAGLPRPPGQPGRGRRRRAPAPPPPRRTTPIRIWDLRRPAPRARPARPQRRRRGLRLRRPRRRGSRSPATGGSSSGTCETGAIRRVLDGHEKDVLLRGLLGGTDLHLGRRQDAARLGPRDRPAAHAVGALRERDRQLRRRPPARPRAVLGCDDGVIRVFDIASGATLARDRGAPLRHQEGRRLAGRRRHPLGGLRPAGRCIWDARTFALKVRLDGRRNTWERSFNWSPDGSRVLAGTFDGTVLVWDAATGLCLGEARHAGEPPRPGQRLPERRLGRRPGRHRRGQRRRLRATGRLTRTRRAGWREVEPASGRRADERRHHRRAPGWSSAAPTTTRIHLFDRGRRPPVGRGRGAPRRGADQLRPRRPPARLRGGDLRGLLRRRHRPRGPDRRRPRRDPGPRRRRQGPAPPPRAAPRRQLQRRRRPHSAGASTAPLPRAIPGPHGHRRRRRHRPERPATWPASRATSPSRSTAWRTAGCSHSVSLGRRSPKGVCFWGLRNGGGHQLLGRP